MLLKWLLLVLLVPVHVGLLVYDGFVQNPDLLLLRGAQESPDAARVFQSLLGVTFAPALLLLTHSKSASLLLLVWHVSFGVAAYLKLPPAVLSADMPLEAVLLARSVFAAACLGVYLASVRAENPERRGAPHWAAYALAVVMLLAHGLAFSLDAGGLQPPPFFRTFPTRVPATPPYLPQEAALQLLVGLAHLPGLLAMAMGLGGALPLSDAALLAASVQLAWGAVMLRDMSPQMHALGAGAALLMPLHFLFGFACLVIFQLASMDSSSCPAPPPKRKAKRR